MHRLLYISTTRLPITPSLLNDILAVSRRNNAALGVTGLLLAGGTRFLQALEGEHEVVTAVYDRILADPRHFAHVKLADAPIAARTFARWAMGNVAAGVPVEHASDDNVVAQLVAPITDPALRGFFDGFVAVKRAA